MSLKAKVIFGKDTRVWKRYPKDNKYEDLVEFVKTKFGFSSEDDFYLQFEDDEKDRVTLATDSDCEEAFTSAREDRRKSVKIYVVAREGPASSEPKTAKTEETKSDDESETTEEESECQKWRRLALDFLMNEEIKALLPQLVRAVIAEYRTKHSEKSLEEIVMSVLSQDKFVALVAHELFTEKVKPLLPLALSKGERAMPILLAINEEMFDLWIPKIVDAIITGLTEFDSFNDMEFAFPNECGLIPMLAPILGSCGFGNQMFWRGGGSGGCCGDSRGEAVHRTVTCDGCNMYPMTGPRYKCTVCPDFDLCQKCEGRGVHSPEHPLIKMAVPVSPMPPMAFQGLHEQMARMFARPHHHMFGGRGRHCPMRRFGAGGKRRGCHWWRHCKKTGKKSADSKKKEAKMTKVDKLKARREKVAARMARLDAKLEKMTSSDDSFVEVIPADRHSLAEDEFEFLDELKQLTDMGFANDENAKALLAKYQGNLDTVVSHLLR